MIGPHQSIIRRFRSGGQGAAACQATLCAGALNRASRSSGRASMRRNMVGTHWLMVTPRVSSRSSARSASKRGMISAVPPDAVIESDQRSGAA